MKEKSKNKEAKENRLDKKRLKYKKKKNSKVKRAGRGKIDNRYYMASC